jgi:Flp pilus assembly protein TadD
MKSLLYATVLLAVIVGSVMLLRSLEPSPRPAAQSAPPPRQQAAVESEAPGEGDAHSGARLDTMSVDRLFAAGENLLATWHPREATRVFERLVGADSSDHRGWVRLVECYAHPLVGREDDARRALRRARETASGDSSFVTALGRLFIDLDYESAASGFSAAAGRNGAPDDGERFLALASHLSGRSDDAAVVARRLMSRNDSDGRAAALAVRVAAATGDLERASGLARDLARTHPTEPYPYVLLAQVEMLGGDGDAAAGFCNNALDLDPRYIPAILTRALLYVYSGQPVTARVSYEKLLLFDDPVLRATARAGIAFVAFHSGEFADGMDAMDEAIRDAVVAGAARRGLAYAFSLVSYLCELGQIDRAAEIVGRWFMGFGHEPEALGALPVHILVGELDAARSVLAAIDEGGEWRSWARALSLDPVALSARIHVAAGDYERALAVLDDAPAAGAAGMRARREFVRGYAAFEGGQAESASVSFAAVDRFLYGVEFPYYGDPVVDVQARYYRAEAAIASGAAAEAATHYRAFLELWGDASWDLGAVSRAREKLAGLDPPSETP